ncbi:SMEK domain-containing protein [Bacteroides cellulosilyticus]|uniref:SMEK domain-containing protein n=1 Tax=Bacteroides cellulosilyticus TaxID=246787 RepID=UPI00356539EB
MITRGYIIGKIIDDLTLLNMRIDTRNRHALFDLTKFTEDFIKEVLNIVYGLHLVNLNLERSNNPGLDLGDTQQQIAYQITATKTSQKVNDTLRAITDPQLEQYTKFKVFIMGEKQTSYTLDETLVERTKFEKDTDIEDINSLLRAIVVLDSEPLNSLYCLFNREFRQVTIELEEPDREGNYETSLYNQLERIPDKHPQNARKLTEFYGEPVIMDDLLELYRNLASVPRITREFLAIIADRGERSANGYRILPLTLKHSLHLSENELWGEIYILENANLLDSDETFDDFDNPIIFLKLKGSELNGLVDWAKQSDYNLRTLFTILDFTILDEM